MYSSHVWIFTAALLLCSVALAQEPTPSPSPGPTEPSSPTPPTSSPSGLVFQDVFSSSGFDRAIPLRSLKFGGPCIADLDSDGNYDIILNFHNRNFTRIFLSTGDGNFKIFIDPRSGRPFRTRVLDVHGISVAQVSTRSRDRIISFSVGGGRGQSLRAPEVYRITPDRDFKEITMEMGLGRNMSRPRNTVFMDLSLKSNGARRRDGGGPDALFVNFLIPPNELTQYAYQNVRGNYSPANMIGDFVNERRGRVDVTDVNGDGIMEVIAVQTLRFYQLIGPFDFVDITQAVLPAGFSVGPITVTATVELDYDNDGRYDLYVARADRTLVTTLPPLPDDDNTDVLLRNVGGVYVDVTAQAGIPRGTNSIGVTTGDFNNDGYVDLLVVLYKEKDMVLLNQRDGTFQRVDGLIPKQDGDEGNNAVGVDYDLDGRVDAMVGHGAVNGERLGPYLLMKNMMTLTGSNHYLLVTVYNDPTGAATSMHAVVTLFMPGRRRMVRRVGSRGGQEAYGSYLDTVHFGLGSVTTVRKVQVTWSSRVFMARNSVAADQRVFFGTQ